MATFVIRDIPDKLADRFTEDAAIYRMSRNRLLIEVMTWLIENDRAVSIERILTDNLKAHVEKRKGEKG